MFLKKACDLSRQGQSWMHWSLSPIYDLNPTPTDLKARVLTTNIDLDDGTCSIDLLQESAGYFGLGLSPACEIIKEVATATWRDVANEMGVRTAEINRMASAFEHDDLEQAQTL
jgi:serine/threonine-protein kinase HipA